MHPFPHPHFGLRRPPLPQFIGAGSISAGPAPLALPPAAQPGDVLLWSTLLGYVTGGAGPAIGGSVIAGRRLTVADFAPGVFTMQDRVVWCVYRGIFAATLRTSRSAVGDVMLPGITKAANCAGLLVTGKTNAPTGSWPNVTAPLTHRIGVQDGGLGSGVSMGDLLDPSLYANGTELRFSGSTGFGSSTTAYLLELTY